jgi:hypothetical protein
MDLKDIAPIAAIIGGTVGFLGFAISRVNAFKESKVEVSLLLLLSHERGRLEYQIEVTNGNKRTDAEIYIECRTGIFKSRPNQRIDFRYGSQVWSFAANEKKSLVVNELDFQGYDEFRICIRYNRIRKATTEWLSVFTPYNLNYSYLNEEPME